MSLTEDQEELVNQFVGVTTSDLAVAEGVLKEFKWNLEAGMDAYFTSPDKYNKKYLKSKPASVAKVEPASLSDYESFFKEYAAPESDIIDTEGMMKLYTNLGITFEDVLTTIIPYYCDCENYDGIKKTEFVKGMSKIGAKNLAELRSKLPKLSSALTTFQELKPIYFYAFKLFRDKQTAHKLLQYEVAALLWGQLIVPSLYPYAEHWKEYLELYLKDPSHKKIVTEDLWGMFYDFLVKTAKNPSELKVITEEPQWPLMIDGYAKYLMEKISH